MVSQICDTYSFAEDDGDDDDVDDNDDDDHDDDIKQVYVSQLCDTYMMAIESIELMTQIK